MVMRENTYVRICGNIRSFGGKRSVIAFKMMPVTDLNELTTHILEVIHCHAALAQANTMVIDNYWGLNFQNIHYFHFFIFSKDVCVTSAAEPICL